MRVKAEAALMTYDLILRNGDIIDPGEGRRFTGDIGIADGKIAAITVGTLPGAGAQELDVAGQIVTPGLVDMHGHCYWGVGGTGLDPDLVGARHGVTTWIDPGSSGAATFPAFKRYIIDQAQVRVIPLLNLSAKGLVHCSDVGELNDIRYIDADFNAATIEEHYDLIAGIKVRAGRSSTGQMGMIPLWIGRELCDQYSIPLMAHISNVAPTLQELLPILRAGDIVTHCFHGKVGGMLMRGKVRDEAWAARERGVLFDVGHGNSSFSFPVAEAAIEQGFPPDSISTDLHQRSIRTSAKSFPYVMSKFLAMGMDIETVVRLSTLAPAQSVHHDHLFGKLAVGAQADIAVFRVAEGHFSFEDPQDVRREGTQQLENTHTIANGVLLDRSRDPLDDDPFPLSVI
jgi:dihydroorotase